MKAVAGLLFIVVLSLTDYEASGAEFRGTGKDLMSMCAEVERSEKNQEIYDDTAFG
jgi:hypothetical protein